MTSAAKVCILILLGGAVGATGSAASTCNGAPVIQVVSTELMPSGYAWQGMYYRFGVTVVDPDGDPLGHRWDFGDGTVSTQAAPTHMFLATGAGTLTLTVRDDPSARCPGEPPAEDSRSMGVVVIDDAMTIAERPGEGVSCVQDATFRTGFDASIVGNCELRGRFADAQAPILEARFYVSDRWIGSDLDAPYTKLFRSVDERIGSLDWKVCFEMVGDVHAHRSCSEPIRFFNAGLIGPG